MDFFDVRRARVRPRFAGLYPAVLPGVWMSARKVAQLVRSADQPCGREVIPGSRMLSDVHFEFRGGRRSRQQRTGEWTPRMEVPQAELINAEGRSAPR
jgi:hypothetical protein